jgi:hypothetical protein
MTGGALAPYAARAAASLGRRFAEPPAAPRSEFQRDRDRIVHCTAFRRLEYKTQVFVNHEGDLFRTRLTHSIEVAQIARSIARRLALDEDLIEAISLAHDLGHTPFGHAGQDALSACMAPWGGFEHNLQSLRVVDELEQRYGAFDGLNLCFETREGILKHCSPANARALGELGRRFLDITIAEASGQPAGRHEPRYGRWSALGPACLDELESVDLFADIAGGAGPIRGSGAAACPRGAAAHDQRTDRGPARTDSDRPGGGRTDGHRRSAPGPAAGGLLGCDARAGAPAQAAAAQWWP